MSFLLNIRKRLDETTAALTTMSKALEIEKKKTDDLLHEMLPAKVATELLAGRTVDAGLILNLYLSDERQHILTKQLNIYSNYNSMSMVVGFTTTYANSAYHL